MNLEVYVRSRGFSQNFDYCWIKATESQQYRVDQLPEGFENDVTNLIYSESPSLVLSRRNNKLFLCITAIESDERVDFSGRQIRISVAWVVNDSKDSELIFRMLAVQALEGNEETHHLSTEILEAVTLGGEYGFQTNFGLLKEILSLDKAKEMLQEDPLTGYTQIAHKLAKLSPSMKKKLAEELLQFRLPKASLSSDGYPLVVVTEIKKEEVFRDALVWRGLSGLINRDDWWTYYPPAQPVGELLWFVMRVLFKFNGEWGKNFRYILESVFLNSDF